jgi:hypothetical protein
MTTTATAPPRPPGSPPGDDPNGVAGVQDALARLVAADPSAVDRDELASLMAASSRVHGWLDSFDIATARRARELADAGRAEGPVSMLGRDGQRSGREAARIDDRADVLDRLRGGADSGSDPAEAASDSSTPAPDSFESALRDGRLSHGHVDALSDAMRRLDADARGEFERHVPELLRAALVESVEAFQLRCRTLARRIIAAQASSDVDELARQRANSKVKRWVDKITGMHSTVLKLDPIRDSQLWSVVNAALTSMVHDDGNAGTPWNQMQVEAFLATVTGKYRRAATDASTDVATDASLPFGAATGRDDADDAFHDRRVPEITIVADLQTLISGLHAGGICETEDGVPIPVSTVRRLCCDAEIVPVVFGTDGVPIDVGRSSRTANRQQRRALRAMYRTCAHPDCSVAFSDCKSHHVRWWWRDLGPTDLDNLIPLCERHHHLVHEGGWSLTMTPERVATWIRPDGVVAFTSEPDRRPRPDGVSTDQLDRRRAS